MQKIRLGWNFLVLKGACKKGKSLINRTHISGTRATSCEQLYDRGSWLWQLSKLNKLSRIGAYWCASTSTGSATDRLSYRLKSLRTSGFSPLWTMLL